CEGDVMNTRRTLTALIGGLSVVVACAAPGSAAGTSVTPAALGPTSVLKVSGNHLVTDGGRTIRLIGMHKEGLDYQCIYDGAGYYDGPHDQASVEAMKRWNINTVRLSLDEDCWLNRHGVASGGTGYRNAVIN